MDDNLRVKIGDASVRVSTLESALSVLPAKRQAAQAGVVDVQDARRVNAELLEEEERLTADLWAAKTELAKLQEAAAVAEAADAAAALAEAQEYEYTARATFVMVDADLTAAISRLREAEGRVSHAQRTKQQAEILRVNLEQGFRQHLASVK